MDTPAIPDADYGFPGPLRDRLVAAILSGEKTTTTSLLAEYELEDEPLPRIGDLERVVDSSGAPVCLTRITGVRVLPLARVPLEHALGEGEGFRDLADWRTAHERFWTSPEFTGPFTARGRQAPAVDDDTAVVCVRLETLPLS
ncbi:ASCH domain-containing protein [Rothia sp. BD8]|uniref:ASCH domain-containing protein n=1 Tax=Rothia kristinae TaxID=37923 RepID=A0A7T4MSG4_9MICC|nr:ASCH domain-containing protein [Rothia kristinae]MDN5640879.1 ASCH domain-containing protein [Actinomycetes bacterium]QQC58704.1 ASCH domain-containing protein [Rothia kristinae]